MTQHLSFLVPHGRYRRTVSIVASTITRWSALASGAATAAVVLAVVTVGTWGSSSVRDLALPSPLGWLLLVAAALSLLGVRAWPLMTLGATGALVTSFLIAGHGYGPVLLTVGVAAFAAARYAAVNRALVVAAAVLAALCLPLWWQSPATPVSGASLDGLLGLLPLTAWVAMPFSAGYARRVRSQAIARSRTFALQEQVARERLRLSQDVHDVVGHGLAAIKMQADVALHVLGDPPADSDPGTAALRAISGSAASALTELREVLGTLGPAFEEAGRSGTPGLGDLDALRDRMSSAGLDLRWTCAGEFDQVPDRISRAAYRVLQEGLTNVLRHGDTDAPVGVEVARTSAGLQLRVRNRAATSTGPPGGAGLPSMRSRVEAVGGQISASLDAGDFRLDARLPITDGGR